MISEKYLRFLLAWLAFLLMVAPPPSPAGPSPFPSPEGRGVITEIPLWAGCWLRYASYWQSCRGNLTNYAPPCGGGVGRGATILCVRNSAQRGSVKSVSSVRERNTLCERRNSPATFVVIISSSGCVLFLTEEHRRTEHTAFHRDIKSTDFTEPYSHLWQ